MLEVKMPTHPPHMSFEVLPGGKSFLAEGAHELVVWLVVVALVTSQQGGRGESLLTNGTGGGGAGGCWWWRRQLLQQVRRRIDQRTDAVLLQG